MQRRPLAVSLPPRLAREASPRHWSGVAALYYRAHKQMLTILNQKTWRLQRGTENTKLIKIHHLLEVFNTELSCIAGYLYV